MKKQFVSTNEFRHVLFKSSYHLNAGKCDRIEIGPNKDKITMYAEAFSNNDEGFPEISMQDGKENCGAIFNLVTSFKLSIVFTSTRNPSRPRMILHPTDRQIKPCLASILKSIDTREPSNHREEKITNKMLNELRSNSTFKKSNIKMVSTLDAEFRKKRLLAKKKNRLLADDIEKEKALKESIISHHEKFKAIQIFLQLEEKPMTSDAISEMIDAINDKFIESDRIVGQFKFFNNEKTIKQHPKLQPLLLKASEQRDLAASIRASINNIELKSVPESYFMEKNENKFYPNQISYNEKIVRSKDINELKAIIRQINRDSSILKNDINMHSICIENINAVIQLYDCVCTLEENCISINDEFKRLKIKIETKEDIGKYSQSSLSRSNHITIRPQFKVNGGLPA